MDYEHTQSSRLTRMGLGLAIAVLTVAMLATDEPGAQVVLGAVVVVLAASWLTFSALTVSLEGGQLLLRFGPGLIRRRIDLASIQRVRPVRNSWWHGWGIRWTGEGWLWNVAGYDAVELEFSDGRRFRVGTDEPAALAAALEQGLRRAPR
ncbi:MAG TPA: hypothetical protein VFD43_09360 [Planctomycetota bacterium]|nr:hypothetical protein [Planctomycetota bacterium]